MRRSVLLVPSWRLRKLVSNIFAVVVRGNSLVVAGLDKAGRSLDLAIGPGGIIEVLRNFVERRGYPVRNLCVERRASKKHNENRT
jgi:hypothetical protein